MQGYKQLLLTAFLAVFFTPLMGQNSDSPYSRYGYGVLNNQSVGAARSMGGISYGLRGMSSNPGNPASYSSVDSLTFIFDMGVSYQKSWFSEGYNSQSNDNGGLDYLTMQFPISKRLGMSFGFLPFSAVGYSYGVTETAEGLTTTKTFTGSGGFSRLYAGLAYEPLKNLSVGANVSYIFGSTTYTRALSVSGIPSSNSQSFYHKLKLDLLAFDFGVQYTLPVNKANQVTVGAVYSPAVKKSGRIDRIFGEYSSSSTLLAGDTAYYRGADAYTDLPQKFGFGFTWYRNENLMVGADATYQMWSKARYSQYMDDDMDQSTRFNDTWRFNAGFEYIIDPRDRSFVKRMKLRGGINYGSSYINVPAMEGKTSDYKEYGATIGFGLPLWNRDTYRTSYVNIGLEYRNLVPSNASLIKEQYLGITVGVCFNELWFFKNKFR
jgi:hypothetical protein